MKKLAIYSGIISACLFLLVIIFSNTILTYVLRNSLGDDFQSKSTISLKKEAIAKQSRSFKNIKSPDLGVFIEADFLVNKLKETVSEFANKQIKGIDLSVKEIDLSEQAVVAKIGFEGKVENTQVYLKGHLTTILFGAVDKNNLLLLPSVTKIDLTEIRVNGFDLRALALVGLITKTLNQIKNDINGVVASTANLKWPIEVDKLLPEKRNYKFDFGKDAPVTPINIKLYAPEVETAAVLLNENGFYAVAKIKSGVKNETSNKEAEEPNFDFATYQSNFLKLWNNRLRPVEQDSNIALRITPKFIDRYLSIAFEKASEDKYSAERRVTSLSQSIGSLNSLSEADLAFTLTQTDAVKLLQKAIKGVAKEAPDNTQIGEAKIELSSQEIVLVIPVKINVAKQALIAGQVEISVNVSLAGNKLILIPKINNLLLEQIELKTQEVALDNILPEANALLGSIVRHVNSSLQTIFIPLDAKSFSKQIIVAESNTELIAGDDTEVMIEAPVLINGAVLVDKQGIHGILDLDIQDVEPKPTVADPIYGKEGFLNQFKIYQKTFHDFWKEQGLEHWNNWGSDPLTFITTRPGFLQDYLAHFLPQRNELHAQRDSLNVALKGLATLKEPDVAASISAELIKRIFQDQIQVIKQIDWKDKIPNEVKSLEINDLKIQLIKQAISIEANIDISINKPSVEAKFELSGIIATGINKTAFVFSPVITSIKILKIQFGKDISSVSPRVATHLLNHTILEVIETLNGQAGLVKVDLALPIPEPFNLQGLVKQDSPLSIEGESINPPIANLNSGVIFIDPEDGIIVAAMVDFLKSPPSSSDSDVLSDLDQKRHLIQRVSAQHGQVQQNEIDTLHTKLKTNFHSILSRSFGFNQVEADAKGAFSKKSLSELLNMTLNSINVEIGYNTSEALTINSSKRIELYEKPTFRSPGLPNCYSRRRCTRDCDLPSCYSNRDCGRGPGECDENCRRTITINYGVGSREISADDPACLTRRAACNTRVELRIADCNRLRVQENAACEVERRAVQTRCDLAYTDCNRLRVQENAACEVERRAVQVRRDAVRSVQNNVASISGVGRVSVEGSILPKVKIQVKSVQFGEELEDISLKLSIQGDATVATQISFTPYDVVGHLACFASWSKELADVKVTLPMQEITLASGLVFLPPEGNESLKIKYETAAPKISGTFQPSPAVALFRNNPDLLMTCPGLITSLRVAEFHRGLKAFRSQDLEAIIDGELNDYELDEPIKGEIPLKSKEVNIGSLQLSVNAFVNDKAIIATAQIN